MKEHNHNMLTLVLIEYSLNLIWVTMNLKNKTIKASSRALSKVASHVLICYITFGLLVMLVEEFQILRFDEFACNDHVDLVFLQCFSYSLYAMLYCHHQARLEIKLIGEKIISPLCLKGTDKW